MADPSPARPRIAVYVDLDLVGDGLIKLPFVRALRHAYPTGELTWVAGRGRSAYGGALAPVVGGLIDRVIEESGVGRGLAAALGGRLDLLIDTQSKLATTLALRRLRPRRFFAATWNGLLSDRWPPRGYRKPRRLIRRLLDILEHATGAPAAPDAALTLPDAAIARAAALLPAGPRYVVQAVGAGGRHKAWPAERHVALAHALQAAGAQPVLILGPDERGLHAALAEAAPRARFPLQEGPQAGPELTIALAARCAAGVAGDCGGGHMLAASGVPMVSLFGPTDPAKFAPWASRLTVLRAQDWGGEAMAAIPVAAVLEALEGLRAE
ncbi:MAG: glycosyltransferase family 9 protein [Rhodospirillales bacterium]|nr:lipopolysaccharide heptosyltransferase family protein [Rhodospirillales bacterium]MDE2200500.1 glycosyltransferase family 9 protein [Rhodospirillales bacterium]